MSIDDERIRNAWVGRISGCQLGKPLEVLSMQRGRSAVLQYLKQANALPLRDYVPLIPGSFVEKYGDSCKERLHRSEPDDDINYTVLALELLETHGRKLSTEDVARKWLRCLPIAATWTAERHALQVMVSKMAPTFAHGDEPGFDLSLCADSEYNDWIGAQIRADLYGWVTPGQPALAARLARADASLTHRGAGVDGAVLVAAFGAAIPIAANLDEALDRALAEIPADSPCAEAVAVARGQVGQKSGMGVLLDKYGHLSVVHTVNNLALVVWALLSHPDDYSAAVGEAVCGGWDTDCNAATVGGLWGLQGKAIPGHWLKGWGGRIATDLAGHGEMDLQELVVRTCLVAAQLSEPFGVPEHELQPQTEKTPAEAALALAQSA